MNRRIAILLLSVFAWPRCAVAQHVESIPVPLPAIDQPAGMTLQDLQNVALVNNPTLVQAAMVVESARGRWTQAGFYPNPTAAYSGFEMGDEGKAGQQGAIFSQQIVMGGKLKLSQAAASREVAQAQQEFEAQRWRVMNDVRAAFYAVLVAQRTAELSRQLLTVGEQAFDTSDALYKADQISRVDVLQARVELNTARVTLQNAENRYLGQWRRLASLVGTPRMQPVPLAGDPEHNLPSLDWDQSLCRLLGYSPELAAARAAAERAKCALDRARVEPIPNLDLMAGPSYDTATRDPIANAQIGITVPLYNRNQGNIHAAEAELRKAQAEVGRVELSLHNRLAAVFTEYANARQQVEGYSRDILPDAQASFDLVTKGYQGGEFSYLTVLTAQRTYVQTNLAYAAALSALWKNTVAIEGLLLTNSLGPAR